LRTGWFATLAVVAVILDSAVAPEIEILGARPDFLVLVVAYAGLVLGARPATIVGFILGLIVDAEQPDYLGLHALSLCSAPRSHTTSSTTSSTTVITWTCSGDSSYALGSSGARTPRRSP